MGFEFLSNFLSILSTVLYFAILARVLTSWIQVAPTSPFFPVIRLIHGVTEPILGPIRKVLPSTGMFDFSPVVALLIMHLLRVVLGKLG